VGFHLGHRVLNQRTALMLLGAAAGAALWFAWRKAQAVTVTDTAAAAGKAVGDAAGGVVLGIGDSIGIPRTDAQLCELAKHQGDGYAASKYCTAGDFLEWTLQGQPSGGASGSW
jgi:hypothetical protein